MLDKIEGGPMFFQHVLKGIAGLSREQAEDILTVTGLQCNWARSEGLAGPGDVADRLNLDELTWHLTRYDEIDTRTGVPFGTKSPFISTTAGTAEQSSVRQEQRAYVFSAFDTASWFATEDYTTAGWIFFGYVFTIGRPSVEHAEFAEEIRDLHTYPGGYVYHHEGELVAKIVIPPVRLERCELYTGPALSRALQGAANVKPDDVIRNKRYADPMRYVNVRGLL
jgi:hypothetical protein